MTKTLPIRMAAGSGPTFGVDDLACAAATHLGCWEEEGLDVTWTPVHGGVAAMQSVLNGETDVSYGGLGPVLKFRAESQPVRIIVSMARALAQNLFVQPDITSPEELRGKSWAIDGFGALSHHMARLVVRALKIGEEEIDWQAVGPPPERIANLLAGTIDVSLIRVEEATSLDSDTSNDLHTLLGFAELKELVPVQPHGVLATTETYEQAHPEELHRLTRGMIRASRALNDDFENFRKVYDHNVTVKVDDEKIHNIWQKEKDSGGFAVNGEITNGHWKNQMELFYELNSELPEISRDDVIAENFVMRALEDLGIQPAQDEPGY
ncbi:MAG: ABC transporter substrate-binding protein [Rhodospirillales bacterium]|jgi:ABC-type nitrate/sulfonate/bicarbonate transport system substrate-binding protein|nr:ABC transporter substrate-binding protein [Rhodospirillales bacterium]